MSQLKVNSITDIGGLSTPLMSGSIVQVQEYRSGVEITSSGPAVDILNVTFTTKFANSKLYLQYYSAQLSLSKVDTNPEITFLVDGVDQGLDTDHIFYGAGTTFRPVVTIPLLTGPVGPAGPKNIKVRGAAYNSGTIIYNYQAGATSPRRPRFIVMEVAP